MAKKGAPANKTVSGNGQNKPAVSGPAGVGQALGRAPLALMTRTTPGRPGAQTNTGTAKPGSLTIKGAMNRFAQQQRGGKRLGG